MLATALATVWARRSLSLGGLLAITLGVTLIGSTGLLFTIPALGELVPLFATGTSISAFIAIFVVASAIAFGVEQRRRELALLRAVGATPRQVRRLIVGETLAIGLVASALGAALSYPAADLTVRFLARVDWLPPGSPAPDPDHAWIALLSAVAMGIAISAAAALPASRRAARARPSDALLQSVAPGRVMTGARAVIGVLAVGGSTAMLLLIPRAPVSGAMALAITSAQVMVVAAAALGPLYLPALIRITGLPLLRLTRASASVALAQVRTGVRRASSTAGPVMASVAIFGSLVGATQTMLASEAASNRAQVTADLVVASTSIEDSLAALPAGSTAVRLPVLPGLILEPADPDDEEPEEDAINEEVALLRADPADLARVASLEAVTGSFAELGGDRAGISSELAQELGLEVGEALEVRLPDGQDILLTVVAVGHLPTLIQGDIIVGARPDGALAAAAWTTERALAILPAGTDPGDAARAVPGAAASTVEDFVAAAERQGLRENWIILVLIAGMATLFSVIAIANTQAMGALERRADVMLLRRTGATPAQVARVVLWEALLTVLAAGAVGVAIGAVSVLSLHALLGEISAATVLVMPWGMFAALAGTGLVVAVVSALAPLARSLQRVR